MAWGRVGPQAPFPCNIRIFFDKNKVKIWKIKPSTLLFNPEWTF